MNDHREFLAAFEAATLPSDDFNHRNHVRAAWLYLRDHEPLEALRRFCTTLRNYAESLGAGAKYHETITWAYLLLIHDRMQRNGTADDWDTFAAANEDLMAWNPSILDRYYRPETLASDHARRVFVMPDAGHPPVVSG